MKGFMNLFVFNDNNFYKLDIWSAKVEFFLFMLLIYGIIFEPFFNGLIIRVMKTFFFTLLFFLVTINSPAYCQKAVHDTLKITGDTVTYELIIVDPEYDVWLLTKPSMNYHSNEYYRLKNISYVREWNYRYQNSGKYRGNYDSYIDYNPRIKYDIALNYRLYYYFVYFEEKNNIKLVPWSR